MARTIVGCFDSLDSAQRVADALRALGIQSGDISLVANAVPGIGPLVAAGSIATALAGAGIGAVAGGLVGGLRHLGVPEPQAEAFADAVGRGAALVAVRIDDARADEVAALMHGHGARDPGAAPTPQAGLHG